MGNHYLIVSSILAFRQLKYTRNQDKLNSLLKVKEEREADSLNEADICANLIDLGRGNERIRVSNIGKCIAKNVNLAFPDGNSWSVFIDPFPIDLQPQQKVDLIIARSQDASIKQRFLFTWKDKKGDQEKSIELS